MACHTHATSEGVVSFIHTSRISFGKLYQACSDAEELTVWFSSWEAITSELNLGGGSRLASGSPFILFLLYNSRLYYSGQGWYSI